MSHRQHTPLVLLETGPGGRVLAPVSLGELTEALKLDDSEQPPRKPKAESNIFLPLPTRGNLWITCCFNSTTNEAAVFLGYNGTSRPAVEVIHRIEAERDAISAEFEKSGLRLAWTRGLDGKLDVRTSTHCASIRDDDCREKQIRWFSLAINTFAKVFRPRVSAAWEELTAD